MVNGTSRIAYIKKVHGPLNIWFLIGPMAMECDFCIYGIFKNKKRVIVFVSVFI